jgi:hypothetical protein
VEDLRIGVAISPDAASSPPGRLYTYRTYSPPSSADETQVQAARVRALRFRLVQTQVCLKKLVDPAHQHSGAGVGTHGCPFQLHLDRPPLWRTASGELFATTEPLRRT